MVWETVKKEMTITRILLAVVAILMCIYLAFGLPHGTESAKENNEQGLEMLNWVREYLERNASQPTTHPQALNGSISTNSSKPRKFYSIAPPFEKPEHETQNTKHNSLNVGNNTHATPSAHSIITNKNSSESEMDFILVFDVDQSKHKDEPEHRDQSEYKDQSEHRGHPEYEEQSEYKDTILDVKNTGTKHVDKIMLNHVIFSKTVRVSKVEEVFEDLVAQNVRRIIKEDRAEKIEISRNKEMETIGDEFGIKDLLSL